MDKQPGVEGKGDRRAEFAREAAAPARGLLREYIDFLAHNKKWWLLPIVLALLCVGLLILFGGSAAAPFIYTLF